MLRIIREGQRWLTGVFVIALGGVFVFFLVPGQGQGPSGGAVIEVGSYRFGIQQFESERARRVARYQEALGDQFDESALADSINDLTAQVLIERSILALEAERLGVRVAKGEIERTVQRSDSFRGEDGRFDRDAFRRFIEYEYGTERNFMVDQRMGMLATKMAQLLDEVTRVSEGEARDALLRRIEEVRIAFVVLGDDTPVDAEEISDEQVTAALAEREEEIRDLYHQRSEIYDVPEQVRARHVLLGLEPDASEEAVALAETQARALIDRIQGGEDFAAIAAEASNDPGSKDNGGDLGFFRRGQMVKPFEDAAFSLEPGVLSEPIKSDFGFHIIRVEEHTEASHTAFEDVREELVREVLAHDLRADANRALADELAAAVAAGTSLEDAARERELTLERSGWLRRRPDGFVPSLGAAQDLMIAAFSMSPGESSDRVFLVGEKLALVQVLERQLPEDFDIEQGIEAERKQLQAQKRTLVAQGWIERRRRELTESGDLAVDLSKIGR
jgi:peptidyl-prolyl cis-trans isomerase D